MRQLDVRQMPVEVEYIFQPADHTVNDFLYTAELLRSGIKDALERIFRTVEEACQIAGNRIPQAHKRVGNTGAHFDCALCHKVCVPSECPYKNTEHALQKFEYTGDRLYNAVDRVEQPVQQPCYGGNCCRHDSADQSNDRL